MDTLHLGTETAPWQIKDFSVALRQAITKAAREQDVTVAEYLHSHFTRYGVDGVVVEPPQTEQTLPRQTSADDLLKLAEAAAKLAEWREKMPDRLASALARRIREAVQPPKPKPSHQPPKLLTGPEP